MSLEKLATLKTISTIGALDDHGLDIIKLFSPAFITNNYKEILNIIEEKSELYTIIISFELTQTVVIHKFVNAEDIRNIYVGLLTSCIKFNWDYDHIAGVREMCGLDIDAYDFDSDSPTKLLEDIKNLDLKLLIKNMLEGYEFYFPYSDDNWVWLECFKHQQQVDDYIHRTTENSFYIFDDQPDIDNLISRFLERS